MVHFYPLNEVISNLMPATGLKEVCMGAIKGKKAIHCEKVQLGEHIANKLIDIRFVACLAIKGMS